MLCRRNLCLKDSKSKIYIAVRFLIDLKNTVIGSIQPETVDSSLRWYSVEYYVKYRIPMLSQIAYSPNLSRCDYFVFRVLWFIKSEIDIWKYRKYLRDIWQVSWRHWLFQSMGTTVCETLPKQRRQFQLLSVSINLFSRSP